MEGKSKYIVIGLGVGMVIFGVAIIFFVIMAVDNFIHMAERAKRSEAPQHLALIREAELMYYKTEGKYLALDIPADHLVEEADRTGPQIHPAWTELGFQPEYKLRCDYKVEVTQDPDDFRATVQCDVDGDGEFAVYSATSANEVERLTDEDVY